ncbi:MAG: MBOAT family O-acyltransferase [Reichenbachiella sp.]|uniref:MBOAT family O-acyltransferase n=1 Tax=Reichenbachiella sp. TaxID=2184521 RepID=UPI00326415E0
MLFSSAVFLFLFLPLVLGIFYSVPVKFRHIILLLASLLFYTWGEEKIVLVMVTSIFVDYSCGLLIAKGHKRLGLILSVLTNLSFLGFFKYFNFTFDNYHQLINWLGMDQSWMIQVPTIALPIGISFYTFQTMSYTIDVYRGKIEAQHNFLKFATFVSMFPQLVAGPIVRYIDIKDQLNCDQTSIKKFESGVRRFIVGLFKKTMIANSCAYVADSIFQIPFADLSTTWAWIGIISYSFQIYYDFSGYSDMAIGLGRMFGFSFLENFNYPYISKNIREFWRRWHISLSSWFRDYLYIPLGGSRQKKYRVLVNLIIVFFITGLWHGASWNFVVWGLFHGFFILLERAWLDRLLVRLWSPLQHLYTLLVVIVAWVFFRADDLTGAISYLSKMFVYSVGDAATNSYLYFFHVNTEVILIMLTAAIFSCPVVLKLKKLIPAQLGQNNSNSKYISAGKMIFYVLLMVISMAFVSSDTYNPFIYFRF